MYTDIFLSKNNKAITVYLIVLLTSSVRKERACKPQELDIPKLMLKLYKQKESQQYLLYT